MESITLEKLANLIGGTPLGSFDLQLSNLQDSKAVSYTHLTLPSTYHV